MYCALLSCFSPVQFFVTPWTVAHNAPLSMGFSMQEYWSGLSCPSPGDLPDPGIEPMSLMSPALAAGFFTTITTWEAPNNSDSGSGAMLYVKRRSVTQLCPTLCSPMDCNPAGSSVHGILQARMLEWVAISFSRGSSPLRDQTWVSHIAGRFFTVSATRDVILVIVRGRAEPPIMGDKQICSLPRSRELQWMLADQMLSPLILKLG